jgi:hypothetical protein
MMPATLSRFNELTLAAVAAGIWKSREFQIQDTSAPAWAVPL